MSAAIDAATKIKNEVTKRSQEQCVYAERTGCCKRTCHHPELSPHGDLIVHKSVCNATCRYYEGRSDA